jgi:MraZ protein
VVEPNQGSLPPPPNGVLSAKIDEKGRLKLPSKLEEYFIGLGARTLFITSLNRTSVRVYTPPAWQETRLFLTSDKVDRAKGRDLLFAANDVGGDSDMDAQGRVLIPQKLRSLLSLENQSVHIECYPGMVNIYTQSRYDARLAVAVDHLEDKFNSLQEQGLP